MTLEGLLYAIGQIGINDKLINFAAAGGSIYEINDLTIRDYPILYVSPTGTHRMSENYTTYQVTIFFIDRLLEDNSNGVAIHSTAVEVLKNIIKKIAVLEDVAGISDEYTIQLFTETEKMKDRCNGAYATIEIMLLNESTCIMPDEGEPTESGDTPTENWYLYFNNPDGETIPAESTAYTVEWRTNIPDIPYIIYGPEGVIENGSTDGEIRKEVDFAENESTAITREYTFMFLKDNGDNLSSLTWYQAAAEVQPEPEPGPEPGPDPEPPTPDTGETDYYFNFTVSDNQVIPADATGFTVSWRTNYPEILYSAVLGNETDAGYLDSGTTSMTFTFPANTSVTNEKEFRFSVMSGEEIIGTLSWSQETAQGYFEFITQDGAVLSSAATSYHVDWDTNYPLLRYLLTGIGNGYLKSGNVSGSGMTATFPASTIATATQYVLRIYSSDNTELGSLTWKQQANGEIPHDYSEDYLTFDIISAGTIECRQFSTTPENSWEYSKDNGETWNYPEFFSVDVQAGDTVLLRGNLRRPEFTGSTATFDVYGNILSMIGESYKSGKNVYYGFLQTFAGTNVVNAKNLVLPTRLKAGIFVKMFYYCHKLVSAPALPSMTLYAECYSEMFAGCNSLVSAPALPALELKEKCYFQMFEGCSSLTTAPDLPATALAPYCYSSMFAWCDSLVNVPSILPATKLYKHCYSVMFWHCLSLTTAPELPATTLVEHCYTMMFWNCPSLVAAPALPATTLAPYCYDEMFLECSSLTAAPVLPATTLEPYCYWGMFNSTNLSYMKCLATNITAEKSTIGWLANVSPTGTFIKKAGAQWESGYNGIPDGWTVQEI